MSLAPCPSLHRLALLLALCSPPLLAQGTLHGTVLSGTSPRVPLAGAHVIAEGLGLRAQTDSAGKFRLTGLPAGAHLLTVQAAGFQPDSFVVEFAADESVTMDFTLQPRVTRLGEVQVSGAATPVAPAKLAGFEERRRAGIGRHLDRTAIEKFENRRTGDLIATIPGTSVRRGSGTKAWVAGSRAVSPGRCAFCQRDDISTLDKMDFAAGARPACYMDVYLDGTLVFDSSSRGVPLFDVNSLSPSQIAAIEVYASASQIPAQYNKTGGGCGVILIWTR